MYMQSVIFATAAKRSTVAICHRSKTTVSN